MAVNTVILFINVVTKQFVSVNGSPTTVPTQYNGDKPQLIICPVQPASSNPNQGYISVNLAGYTANIIMAGTPNATNPPTPFASLDGLLWNANAVTLPTGQVFGGFSGIIDLTQAAVATFIGTNASLQAWITIDVTDNILERTTFIQQQFTISASNDTPAIGPSGPGVQYLTVAQALNLFVQIGPIPGKQIIFQSQDSTKKVQQTLGNDGVLQENPL